MGDARFEACIENVQFFEVSKDGDGCVAVPRVADGLKVVVSVFEVARGLFGFNEKLDISKIWRKEKGIIGAALRALHADTVFNFDFLFIGIF